MASCSCKATIVLTTLGLVIGAVVPLALGYTVTVVASMGFIGAAIGGITGAAIIGAELIVTENHQDSIEQSDYVALQGLDSSATAESWGVLRQVSDLESCE